ncbi:MAG: ATP-dependent metallopeptidase FtsH/Yme1/Tma family protein, partial [Acidobacteriota bacterium]
MNSTFRSLLFWIVIFGVVVLLWQAIQGNVGDKQELPFNEFLAAVENGEIVSLNKKGLEVTGKFRNSQTPANK